MTRLGSVWLVLIIPVLISGTATTGTTTTIGTTTTSTTSQSAVTSQSFTSQSFTSQSFTSQSFTSQSFTTPHTTSVAAAATTVPTCSAISPSSAITGTLDLFIVTFANDPSSQCTSLSITSPHTDATATTQAFSRISTTTATFTYSTLWSGSYTVTASCGSLVTTCPDIFASTPSAVIAIQFNAAVPTRAMSVMRYSGDTSPDVRAADAQQTFLLNCAAGIASGAGLDPSQIINLAITNVTQSSFCASFQLLASAAYPSSSAVVSAFSTALSTSTFSLSMASNTGYTPALVVVDGVSIVLGTASTPVGNTPPESAAVARRVWTSVWFATAMVVGVAMVVAVGD